MASKPGLLTRLLRSSRASKPARCLLKVPAEQLHQVLGIRNVHYVQGKHALALVEAPLG